LAPYESSVKTRSNSITPPESSSIDDALLMNQAVASNQNSNMNNSNSLSASVAGWNPFGTSPFSPMSGTEFDKEFDKLSKGSQSSTCFQFST